MTRSVRERLGFAWYSFAAGAAARSGHALIATIDSDGQLVSGRGVATRSAPFSTLKVVAALVAREWIVDLDESVEVTHSDLVSGSSAGLMAGDLVRYRDLIHASLLPSGNDAMSAVARTVGARMPGGENATSRFVAAMNTKGDQLGWVGHVLLDATGKSPRNRVTPLQLAQLMKAVHDNDPWLWDVMRTKEHVLNIGGPMARRMSVQMLPPDPTGTAAFPELVAHKTGSSVTGVGCIVAGWVHPQDKRVYYTGIIASKLADRARPLRATIDKLMDPDYGDGQVRVTGMRSPHPPDFGHVSK